MVDRVVEGVDSGRSVRSWTGVPYLTSDQLQRVFSVEEFEPLAKERMIPSDYGYVAGWAGTGASARANGEAFWRWVFRPRTLVDVHAVDLRTTVLGQPIALPVLFGPSGYQRLSHPHGELATASAAERVGTTMVLSTSSNYTIEEIGQIAKRPWLQLYWFTDEGVTRDLVERAAAAGYAAVALTVDAPSRLWREGEMRTPPEEPPGIISANLPDRPLKIAPNLTWRSLEWLRSISPMKIVLKGILTAEDTRLAVEHGVDGVIVSNHGGRTLDWSMPTLDALPDVVEAADGRLEVYLDGGVRRGTDVLKALALGARAVLLGRAIPWGLATGGEDGVVRMVELIRGELESVMGLTGATTVDRIDRSIVARLAVEIVA
ncbi:MAG TPA: alpha-hydroxy acid oxidase [Candidatus Saccharimonadales bacterium]|nr:alpha-hydroxy acid oxidase [Candidatus Saccharimonadales bacterium]